MEMIRVNHLMSLWLLVFVTACQPIMAQSAQTQPRNLPRQEVWTTFSHSDEISDLVVQGDQLWATTESGVVRWNLLTGEHFEFPSERGLASRDVQSIAVAADGTVWFGTDEGVSRLAPDGSWTSFSPLNGLVDDDVHSIVVAADGTVWFGTDEGVSRLAPDGSWATFTPVNGLVSRDVQSIAVAADGTVWFGTDEGVSRLAPDGSWATFTPLNGLVDDDVQSIVVAADGTVWFGTDEGVSRFTPDGTQASLQNSLDLRLSHMF
jgi:ligand-binding sensor domain-containing protein